MTPYSASRATSLLISLLGVIFNFALAIQILSLWKSIKWESEAEWEGSVSVGTFDGVKLVWCLLSSYFLTAATVCLVGFLGILRNKASFVKFYRDYSIADVTFCSLFTVVATYSAVRTPLRTGVCEHLSQRPDLMRYMAEMGLSLENCELWFERIVLVFLALMIVLIVVRLHFLVAVSKYYKRLNGHRLPTHTSHSRARSGSLQRIFLLPRPVAPPSTPSSPDDVYVYAPVPLSALSPKAARDVQSTATECWIPRAADPNSSSAPSHRHVFGPAFTGNGEIQLPVTEDEGLFPSRHLHKA